MAILKTSYFGNSLPGLNFLLVGDLFFCPPDTPEKVYSRLEVQVIKTTVASSDLLGLYCFATEKGVVLPNLVEEEEKKVFEETGLEVYVSPSKANAWGNLIAGSRERGLLSPRVVQERENLENLLGLKLLVKEEVLTPGSLLRVSPKGALLSYRIEDLEQEIRKWLEVETSVGSVNSGYAFVGLGVLSNGKDLLIGEASTGFEIGEAASVLLG